MVEVFSKPALNHPWFCTGGMVELDCWDRWEPAKEWRWLAGYHYGPWLARMLAAVRHGAVA